MIETEYLGACQLKQLIIVEISDDDKHDDVKITEEKLNKLICEPKFCELSSLQKYCNKTQILYIEKKNH